MPDPDSNILNESSSDSGSQLADGGKDVAEQKPSSSIFDSGVIFRRSGPDETLDSKNDHILDASGLTQTPLHKQLQREAEAGTEELPEALPVAAEVPTAKPLPASSASLSAVDSGIVSGEKFPGFEPTAGDSGSFAGFEPEAKPTDGQKSTYRPRQRHDGMPIGSLILAAVLGPVTVWIGWTIYHAVIDDKAEPVPTAQPKDDDFEFDTTPFQPLKDDEQEGGFRPGAQNEPTERMFRPVQPGNFFQTAPEAEQPQPEVQPDAEKIAAGQEKEARRRYRQALKWIKTDPETARSALEEIVRRYPDTSAAAQARLQLATLQRE